MAPSPLLLQQAGEYYVCMNASRRMPRTAVKEGVRYDTQGPCNVA